MLLVSLCLCVLLSISLPLLSRLTTAEHLVLELQERKKLQSSNSSLLANLRCFHNFSDLNSFFPLYSHSNKIHEHFHKARPTQKKNPAFFLSFELKRENPSHRNEDKTGTRICRPKLSRSVKLSTKIMFFFSSRA